MARILSERSIRRRARLAQTLSRAKRTVTTETSPLREALEAVKATTSAVKVPNGTTKKIDRIVTDALASV